MKFLVLQHINIEHPGIFLKFMKEDIKLKKEMNEIMKGVLSES